MRRIVICVFLILFAICTINCIAKKQWQGKYISVSYTKEAPKEDFKVSSYTVVAYDIRSQNKHSAIVYRFVIMIDKDKVGALELCDMSMDMEGYSTARGKGYCIIAGDFESMKESLHEHSICWRDVHKIYPELPDYETVKSNIKDILIYGK